MEDTGDGSMRIDLNDILPLEQRHRDVMLDLVLAWGALDGALGMLLSSVKGVPLDEGAMEFSALRSSAKLHQVCQALRDAPNGAEAARILKKHKRRLERHSQPRNRIAHSNCGGVWAVDPEYIVFLPFKKFAEGELTCEAIPIQEMERASRWGRAMTNLALKIEDAITKQV